MKILSFQDFKSNHSRATKQPAMSVSKNGKISFNREAIALFKVQENAVVVPILFSMTDDGTLCAKKLAMATHEAFLFKKLFSKAKDGKKTCYEMSVMSGQFKDFLVKKFDLALKPGQKTTVRLDVTPDKDGLVRIS
jgi:hypothetical protein